MVFRLTPRDTEVSWSLRNPEARYLGDEDQLKQIKFTPMSTKLLELDRRYFDAWHNHDADAIAAAFSENSNYTHPALPEPLVGGPAVAEWAKTVWTILPDFKLDLVSRDATGMALSSMNGFTAELIQVPTQMVRLQQSVLPNALE